MLLQPLGHLSAVRRYEALLPDYEISAEARTRSIQLADRARAAGVTVPLADLLVFACATTHALELARDDYAGHARGFESMSFSSSTRARRQVRCGDDVDGTQTAEASNEADPAEGEIGPRGVNWTNVAPGNSRARVAQLHRAADTSQRFDFPAFGWRGIRDI